MFTAIYLFLGIGGFLVLALTCLSTEEPAADGPSPTNQHNRLTWSKSAKWPEIRAAWLEWYVRTHEIKAPKRKAMLSWGRTMALCAAICLVGIVLAVELDERESAVSRIWSSYKPHRFPHKSTNLEFSNSDR